MKQYIVAVKTVDNDNEIFSFPSKVKRASFIKEIKKFSSVVEIITSEVK